MKKLTLEEIKERLAIINPNIEILSKEYIGNQKPLKCKCKIDGNEWNPNWDGLRLGRGCPVCGGNFRPSLEEVKLRVLNINSNIEILSKKYINARTNLDCKCLIDGHEWKISYDNIHHGYGCPQCKIKAQSGENNWNWKGGISSLAEHLRGKLGKWKCDSIKNCDYKCDVTGEKFDTIHHPYGFNQIVREATNCLNISIYNEINEYTGLELKQIEDKCLELHYKHGLGVCLTEDAHKEFHSIYGYGDNTPEQYEEFKTNKLLTIKQ